MQSIVYSILLKVIGVTGGHAQAPETQPIAAGYPHSLERVVVQLRGAKSKGSSVKGELRMHVRAIPRGYAGPPTPTWAAGHRLSHRAHCWAALCESPATATARAPGSKVASEGLSCRAIAADEPRSSAARSGGKSSVPRCPTRSIARAEVDFQHLFESSKQHAGPSVHGPKLGHRGSGVSQPTWKRPTRISGLSGGNTPREGVEPTSLTATAQHCLGLWR